MIGDVAAVNTLLTRDYAVGDLLARAAAAAGAAGADVAECVALAWEQLLAGVASGSAADCTRGALLERVILVLDERQLLDTAAVTAPECARFLPSDNRWAGWWDNEPAEWPPGSVLAQAHVIGALRHVPLGSRVLLVLRDAAGISAREAEPIVKVSGPLQATLLDEARQHYVAAIDQQLGVAEGLAGKAEDAQRADDSAKADDGLRTIDVSCDVIFGLIGRWLDGAMEQADRDIYEQHLLFCPACLRQADKTRLALTALREAAAGVPDSGLRHRLAAVIRPGS